MAVFYVAPSGRGTLYREAAGRTNLAVPVSGIPDGLKALAQEALQYVLQDVDGSAVPVVTAAFWADPDSKYVATNESWADALRNGACLVERQMLPLNSALQRWADDLQLAPEQVAMVDRLAKCRFSVADKVVHLAASESQRVRDLATSDEGFQACRESLAEVGIVLAPESGLVR